MTTPREQAPEPHTDPQTHLDTDPANRDSDDDPADDGPRRAPQ